MVEMVGRNTFHAAACHCHSRIGFETCHAKERDQCTGNVFAYTATVGIVHFCIVKRVAFAFPHRDTGVADIVGYPMGEDGNLFHLGFLSFDQFVYLFLCFG